MSLLPTISLSGGPGSRSEEFGDLLDNRFRTWDISGGITQPLFNGGRIRANIRRSEALKKAMRQNYEQLLFCEHSPRWKLCTNEVFAKRGISAECILCTAQTAAKTSWDRYQRGVQGIFDTLDSQRRAFEAKGKLLSTRKIASSTELTYF